MSQNTIAFCMSLLCTGLEARDNAWVQQPYIFISLVVAGYFLALVLLGMSQTAPESK